MIKYIQFLHDVYKGYKDESKKKKLLISIIVSEARLNNDIATVIKNTGPKIVAEKTPDLFKQFETSSYELLTSLGVSSSDIFSEENDLETNDIDLRKNTVEYFKNKPKSELYDFYIRKVKLLKALADSNSIWESKVRLTTRIHNITLATRFLSKI